jgi:hypothetical protein
MSSDVLADLAREVARQDELHPPGFPATRDGVFMAIMTAVHELDREAIEAWRAERCRCGELECGHATWADTRTEVMQAAAVLVRVLRSIDESEVPDVE